MKKLSLAVAVAATLGAGVANAYTVAEPGDGVLVPNVIHNGPSDTTAVGLINHSTTAATVYWTFFDQNSKHIADGQFQMTGNDFVRFVWAEESGLGLEGMRGYLTFNVGVSATDPTPASGMISAAAFQADAVLGDAVFVPTFPIDQTDLDSAATDLTNLDENSLVNLASGAPAGDTVDLRYEFSGDFQSRIVVWSTGGTDGTVAGGGLKGTRTVNMYDDNQDRRSVNFTCDFSELCFIDPTTIIGRPAGFTSGFIRAQFGNSGAGDFVSYTAVRSASFGATQTILNTHY